MGGLVNVVVFQHGAYDHATAVWAILTQGKIGETYLVGANGEKDNLSVLHDILKDMGKAENDFDFVQDRSGHDLRYAIDATKMREERDWEPKYTDFSAGWADTIKWYEDNQPWWEAEKSAVELKYAQNNQ